MVTNKRRQTKARVTLVRQSTPPKGVKQIPISSAKFAKRGGQGIIFQAPKGVGKTAGVRKKVKKRKKRLPITGFDRTKTKKIKRVTKSAVRKTAITFGFTKPKKRRLIKPVRPKKFKKRITKTSKIGTKKPKRR